MADNLAKYVPDLNEEDKKNIKYAVNYETWRTIHPDERGLGSLRRAVVIAALRKVGCHITADKLARDK